MVGVNLFLPKFSAMKIVTLKCHVGGFTKSCHGIILGKHTINVVQDRTKGYTLHTSSITDKMLI